MQIKDVFTDYADEMKQVEVYLDSCLNSDVKLIPEVGHHLLDSGGKRFRPLLHLICSRLCGYEGENRFLLAAAIEFIHTASLFHDDVIDEATLRRGKMSANRVWGNAASVLVGDFLYSKSFRLLSDIGNLEVFRIMATMSNIMSEGEVFQLMKCGDTSLTEKEYLSIVEKKTAALIASACESAAVLGRKQERQILALKQFGCQIGMAFQITDDTLDYMAREEEFGKSVGKDLEEGKMTLPLIYALSSCSQKEQKKIKDAIGKKDALPAVISNILEFVQQSGGIDYALQRAQALIDKAKEELQAFAGCPETKQLAVVADYILARKM